MAPHAHGRACLGLTALSIGVASRPALSRRAHPALVVQAGRAGGLLRGVRPAGASETHLIEALGHGETCLFNVCDCEKEKEWWW